MSAMAEYLVVAHQTATSAELRQHLQHLAATDDDARFTLLVPATDPSHLLVWEPGEAVAIAQARAEEARRLLERDGLKIVRVQVGDAAPLSAIEEELAAHPNTHAQVILCTLPPAMSHWLGLDLPAIASEQFDVPVVHIVAGTAYR
jgi:hypothetical protein